MPHGQAWFHDSTVIDIVIKTLFERKQRERS